MSQETNQLDSIEEVKPVEVVEKASEIQQAPLPQTEANEGQEKPEQAEVADDEEESLSNLPLPGDEEVKSKNPLPAWMIEKDKKLKRKREEVEKRNAELDARDKAIAEREAEIQRILQPAIEQADPNRPKRDHFNSDDDYIDAVTDYKINRKEAERQEEQSKRIRNAQIAEIKAKQQKINQEGVKRFGDDYEEATAELFGESFPFNPGLAGAVSESEFSADIIYMLGKNISHARKIAGMSPISAAKEIAKLEVRFEERKKNNKTKAPKPPSSLGNGTNEGATAKGASQVDKMTPKEFEQWYKKQTGKAS